jgi:thiol-disulfide isomerase/thioredoxin
MLNFKDKNLIILVLLIVCGVLGGMLVYTQFGSKFIPGKFKGNILSGQEAAELALNYINDKLLSGETKASLVGQVTEEKGLYKFQIKIGSNEFFSYVTKDGKILFPQGINLEEEKSRDKAKEKSSTLGNFSVSEDEICKEGEKPIVYFFGSERCPHCRWEHPIMEEVAGKFAGLIAFHNNMDTDVDMDIFQKYSTGGIPTLVLGCKYYRVGSGENIGEEQETKVLTALICDLTGNKPTEVCNQVQDLINQINP